MGALIYGLCASGEKQPWAETEEKKQKEEGIDNRGMQLDKSGN